MMIKKNKQLFSFLLLGLLMRVGLSLFGTLELDHNTFVAWGRRLSFDGFNIFYSSWSDYLPGYLYILAFIAEIEKIVSLPTTLLYKIPAILSDVATSYLIFQVASKRLKSKYAFFASLIYLFNPAIISNSTLWGQADSLTVLFSLLSVYFFQINLFLSSVFLAFGVLVKPQAALAAMVILYLMFQKKLSIRDFVFYVLSSALVFALAFIPFVTPGENLAIFIYERLNQTLTQYPYTSINAFNFWGLWGFWKEESVGFINQGSLGVFLTVVVSVFVLIKNRSQKGAEYLFLATLFLTNFTFFSRMHERHLLPALAPLLIFSTQNPFLLIPYLLLSITYLLNLNYSYVWISNNFIQIYSNEVIILFILLNLLSLFLLVNNNYKKINLYELVKSFSKRKPMKPPYLDKSDIKERVAIKILFAILVFAFASRLLFLSSPKHEYFDEVYHAFTARKMLVGDPKAWVWWNDNPEGFAYEWTHPPLAKEMMVLGMTILGECPIGWRFPAALFGTGSVFMVYLIAKKLFKNDCIALLASAVFALDGLALVMSRIGMNDIYFIFFMLLSFYMFLGESYFLSALMLGFSLSSKWSALWFIPILFVGFFALKKRFKKSLTFYLVVPPAVYLSTYLPMFFSGFGLDIFWGVQKQMWWYHTKLVATHAYTSPFWSWPLMLKPIWLYTSSSTPEVVGNIYAEGNPIIFWVGIISVFSALIYVLKTKDKKVGVLVFSYFAFFVPWALSPRIMFLYHYLPSLPFMSILIGFILWKNKKMILPFFALSLLLFLYFYPHWIGIEIPRVLDESYYWIPSWK